MESGKGKKIIGIPKTFVYYLSDYSWKEFFELLGFEVIISQDSDNETFKVGSKVALSEQCYPVKVFYGHVLELINKVDYIFIPQYASFVEGTHCCPTVIGLSQMVQNTVEHGEKVIFSTIDMNDKKNTIRSLKKMCKQLNVSGRNMQQAMKNFTDYFIEKKRPQKTPLPPKVKPYRIGVVGHLYGIHDNYLNMGSLNRFKDFGVEVVTYEQYAFGEDMVKPNVLFGCQPVHWDFGRKSIYSVDQFLNDDSIDGIVFISFFGCGADAFIEEVFKDAARKGKPYVSISIDEHSGEAGLITRIEAFIDMIRGVGQYEV